MSDRPVGDRPGQPGEHESSEAKIRTLLDEQKEQILADCQARISQHEFQAAQAEEEQRLFQGLLWQQKLDFREAHQRGLTEMEELRKFRSSAIRHHCKTKISRGPGTLELTGKMQDLKNEVNCHERFQGFSGC